MANRAGTLVLAAAVLSAAGAFGAWPGPGEKMYNELVGRHHVYADEKWQAYVTAIGQRLLAQTPHAGEEYHFVVTDDPGLNAFATADAYIFVNRGLLAYLKSEDELAAVIGHEIGHVVGEHQKKRKRRELAGKAAGLVAAAATYRPELMRMSQALTNEQIAGYGREMELEADRLGAGYMAAAGYNPLAVIDVIQVLKDQELFSRDVQNRRANYHGLFSSHPKNDKRLHDAVAHAQNVLPAQLVDPVGDFWDLLDGVVWGDKAGGTVVRDNTLFNADLRVVMTFPAGWDVSSSNNQIAAKPPGGAAEGTLTVARHAIPKRRKPGDYVRKEFKRDDIVTNEEFEVHGYPAWIGEVDTANSPTPLMLMGVIYKGQDLFLFSGQCGNESDPDAFRDAFMTTFRSVRAMSLAEVAAAETNRIRVIPVSPGDTFAVLARSTPIRRDGEEVLRLLNGGHPHGEPRAGDYVKLIR